MVVLFLHRKEAGPGGKKPTYLAANGLTVINPALPADDFDAAIRIAQAAFDEHKPAVVVGSSRGGAVAMNINSGEAGLVLLCPAWKKWGTATTVKQNTIVLHSKTDEVIPFEDSEDLARRSNLSDQMLVPVGVDHRLASSDALSWMLDAVGLWTPSELGKPREYGSRVSASDRVELDLIHAELERKDISAERREELEWALSGFADQYCFGWLEDDTSQRQ